MDVRSDTAWGGVSHSLLLFPSVALEPGGRYGVVVTRRAFVTADRVFDASPFFRAARDDPPAHGAGRDRPGAAPPPATLPWRLPAGPSRAPSRHLAPTRRPTQAHRLRSHA